MRIQFSAGLGVPAVRARAVNPARPPRFGPWERALASMVVKA